MHFRLRRGGGGGPTFVISVLQLSDSREYPTCNAYTRWALVKVKIIGGGGGWVDICTWAFFHETTVK